LFPRRARVAGNRSGFEEQGMAGEKVLADREFVAPAIVDPANFDLAIVDLVTLDVHSAIAMDSYPPGRVPVGRMSAVRGTLPANL
jgi:hypothetical protein